MKRQRVQFAFALLCAALALLLITQWLAWRRATDAEAQIGRAADDASVQSPEARLARASAIAQRHEAMPDIAFEQAEQLFAELGGRPAPDPVGRAARYDLANGWLREGLREGTDPARARGYLELAKQRYRDVLKVDPDDWDARFNLERALRAAPDSFGLGVDDKGDPVKSVDVVVPDFEQRDLP